ncbi:alpha/beta hydrolase [Massilia sp. erpn]|nr:alpha/beta hydrolase [Massilia sp. erpn]
MPELGGSMQFLTTERLHIAYREYGPPQGAPVFLLHGWPDDVHTWNALAPALADQGYRVLVPSLRGSGDTRFRDSATPRSGQLSALAQDVFDMALALEISRFRVVGHDWGARAAYNAALLAPEKVERCVGISVGWGSNDPHQTLSLAQARNYWYHWYMATERGAVAVRKERRELAHLLWQTWSPGWQFNEADFRTTAHAFDNPDWASVTVHSYRHRWGWAESDPYYSALETELRRNSVITVPTLTLHGALDGANGPATSEHREHLFAAPYRRVLLDGVGHFPQREQPALVAQEVIAWLR